jgi:hypothetical protein
MAPLRQARSTCPASENPLLSGLFGGNAPKPNAGDMSRHGHSKRQLGPLGGLQPPFSVVVIKGNEVDDVTFAPVNNTAVKSGYWIDEKDPIIALVEVINCKKPRRTSTSQLTTTTCRLRTQSRGPPAISTSAWGPSGPSNAATTKCTCYV